MKLFLCSIFMFVSTIGFSQNLYKIADVKNNIVLGPMAGNRDLSFGVKNLLEEVVQDYGVDLSPDASNEIQVTLLYFDVKKTATQLAVYGKTSDVTEIIAQAEIIVDGKSKKKVTAKGEAKSISTATLIIDKGGKFSQTDVSTALKKVCEQLIEKLKL